MILWALLVAAVLTVGLTLLLIEIFTPGFGVVGFTGIALAIGGAVLGWAELTPTPRLLAYAGGVAGTAVVVWRFRKSGVAQQMVLSEVQGGKAASPGLVELVGKVGRALTPLRPSGSVRIDGRVVDVVTEGVYVEPGTEVRISRVEGTKVLAEPVRNYQSSEGKNG